MSDGPYLWLAVFFCLGAIGTWGARRYAVSRRLLDAPGERRSHRVPTPRGGGIAIVAGTVLAAVFLALPSLDPVLLAFALGMAAVAAVGWVDDHRPLSPWARLGVHALAAAAFAAVLALGGAGTVAIATGFLAPLVLTNIWNFMDGIDGIAASQAVIVVLACLPFLPGTHHALALALVAACMGFLPFNFPRARIFMGDVGSGAVGFAIGALLALSTGAGGYGAAWLLLPLAPFLVDSSLTLLRRVVRGERWWTPHVQHAYQVAARRFGHVPVTLAYGLVAAAGLAVAWYCRDASLSFMSFSLLAWYMSAAVLWLCLQGIEHQGGRQSGLDKEI
ncbi:MraY family glycosyltransferase [Marilutibacter aestuarii]|uniref:MraY family glycosyltransferase n=1 Tax=Marilutibacter aestuarii TaxID=1706195 RepID=UPI001FE31963|nr:glycosyltransferase family 4 protein [Lysobacter aestuarii]